RVQRLRLVENVKEVILLVVLGYGISISNSVQALGGLFSPRTGTFSRTPKYAIEARGQTWEEKKYQISSKGTTALELSATILAGAALVYGVVTSNYGILPILAVYLTGYSFVLYLTLTQTMRSKGLPDR
ncbi:MAG TPA: hypothetical protein VJR06_03190, partial [Nitrososphaerales archaeon]|nr:hypothetical protein [Nitrososphaerales archaeon]